MRTTRAAALVLEARVANRARHQTVRDRLRSQDSPGHLARAREPIPFAFGIGQAHPLDV